MALARNGRAAVTYAEMKRMAAGEFGFYLDPKRDDWQRIVAVIEAADNLRWVECGLPFGSPAYDVVRDQLEKGK